MSNQYSVFIGGGVADLDDVINTNDPLEAVSLWFAGQTKYPTCCQILTDSDDSARDLLQSLLTLDDPEEMFSYCPTFYVDKLLEDVKRNAFRPTFFESWEDPADEFTSCGVSPFTYG